MSEFWAGFLTAYAVSVTLVFVLAAVAKARSK